MTNEELDELQKVRSIVDKFKDIDEKVCTPEQVFDEEEIIKNFLENAYDKLFVPVPDKERRRRILERYNNLPDTDKILVNLENGKYDGCRMYNRNSTLQKRADWIMEDLINNGAAWIDGFNRKLKEDFIDASIPEQILQELNVKRLTNAKFQHLEWEVKNINRELYMQAENNYHEKFKQVYGLEFECVDTILSKIYCINRRFKELAREEELRLAKLDRKNAHSVFDPFHVTHYHRDKRQGYRARKKRY